VGVSSIRPLRKWRQRQGRQKAGLFKKNKNLKKNLKIKLKKIEKKKLKKNLKTIKNVLLFDRNQLLK
jgi:hypothetical protein